MHEYRNTSCSVHLVLALCTGFLGRLSLMFSLIDRSSLSWVRSHEILPFHGSVSMGFVLVQVSFRQPYCWGIVGETSLSFPGDTISHQFSCSSGSYKRPAPLLHSVLWALGTGDVYIQQGNPRSCLCLQTSCNFQCLWWGVRPTLIYVYKDKYVERSRD